MRPVVVSVAGFDPSGGAGLQADCKTIEACGGWAASVVTAIVVQNGAGVSAIHPIPRDQVEAQLAALLDDLQPAAIKSGVLARATTVSCLAHALRSRPRLPFVIDPVGCASSGMRLTDADAFGLIRDELLGMATLVTPNVDELVALSGMNVVDHESAEAAARQLCRHGARAVLAKGGHLPGAESIDLLVTGDRTREYHAARVDHHYTHGTGCVLASAVATALARGKCLNDAVDDGKQFVTASLQQGRRLGRSEGGAVDPTAAGRALPDEELTR